MNAATPTLAQAQSRGTFPSLRTGLLLIIGVGLALFALRLAAPPNLLDQDQERPASYVLDAVKNGNWICQRDFRNDITSKPPLWTWLSAVVTLVCGRISVFTLYLPGALASLGSAVLVFLAGRKRFGPRTALFGALALLLTTAWVKALGLARTDAVFAFTVTAAAFAAYKAWSEGKGWTWFWLLASAATLTKGPLGVILGAGGLCAAFWERKSGNPAPLRGSQLPGILLFLAIAGGWFLLAYMQYGQALIDKMLGKELAGHLLKSRRANFPGLLFYQPPLYYLGRAAPWSLLAYFGLWRLWKHPAANAAERRFERFLFCWFAVGMLIFCIAPHQRADLLWPILPAGALLAGREVERLVERWQLRRIPAWIALMVALAFAGFIAYYFGPHARQTVVQRTIALKHLASEIERRAGRGFPVRFVDTPMTLQVYLDTLQPVTSWEEAAEALRGPTPAFVAVIDEEKLRSYRQAGDPEWHTVLSGTGPAKFRVSIVGNRPELSSK